MWCDAVGPWNPKWRMMFTIIMVAATTTCTNTATRMKHLEYPQWNKIWLHFKQSQADMPKIFNPHLVAMPLYLDIYIDRKVGHKLDLEICENIDRNVVILFSHTIECGL